MEPELEPPQRYEGEERRSGSALTGPLSCVQCRSRKLKCDRNRPICGRCIQHNETCNYPAPGQRGLGRRKTVRELEERIEELEGLLRAANLGSPHDAEPELPDIDLNVFGTDPLPSQPVLSLGQPLVLDPVVPGYAQQSENQLIDLGLFEQLPSFDLMDELTAIYFRNIHAGAPMLHQASYTAALRLPPHMRPPMCLQYIVMASAAATFDPYRHLAEPFYHRARVYAEAEELKGQGETFTTLAHVQSWCLISAYECHVYAIFTRASTSLCRSVRIAQMLKLHQLDGQTPESLQSGLPPPRHWIEGEERRRTWWVVFLADRYLTAITGWPSLIDERHLRTSLPATEESFAVGTEEPPISLRNGLRELRQGRATQLSPFAIRILAANELLHALDHGGSHQFPKNSQDDPDDTPNVQYWQRHREIDTNLTTLTMFLPERLHLSRNPRSLDAILVHISTNMATIHLHRTALGLVHRHLLAPHLIAQSQARLLPAAEGILAVFRAAGDGVGTAIRNPLLSFAAYMAASVFLEHYFQVAAAAAAGGADEAQAQYQSRQSEESLDFLASTLVFFGRSSPLVRANAFQLAADMQRTGYDASMMNKVMDQCQTLGGSTSEIRVPGPRGLPMVFCPALTSTPGASQDSAFGFQGGFSPQGHNDRGISIPLYDNFIPDPSAAGGGVAPSILLQAGSPEGLFSQFEGSPGSFYL